MPSVQLADVVHGAVLLIIRRSWVRAPPAPPAVRPFLLGLAAGTGPKRKPQPEVEPASESEISPRADQEADGQSGPDDQAARLDRLVGQTAKAALRFAAEEATRKARAEYAARLEREAHAEPEHIVRA